MTVKRWVVRYCAVPTAYNSASNAIVEAETPEAARELVLHQLGDFNGVHNYKVEAPVEYVPPQITGRIITMKGGA